MKNDLSDVKSLVYELIRTNDLNVPDIKAVRQLSASSDKLDRMYAHMGDSDDSNISDSRNSQEYYQPTDDELPIILDHNTAKQYDESEVVDEILSLEAMEKDMITKALQKYKGRRKDAAGELGISERTLYRKIKQYEIEE